MAKRWKRWEVGYYGKDGYWVKITTILAPDREMAICKARVALDPFDRWSIAMLLLCIGLLLVFIAVV